MLQPAVPVAAAPVVLPGPVAPTDLPRVAGPPVVRAAVPGPFVPRAPRPDPSLAPVRPAAPALGSGSLTGGGDLAAVLPVGAPLAGPSPRAGNTVRRTLATASRVVLVPARLAKEVASEVPGLAADVQVTEAVAEVTKGTLQRPVLPLGMIALVVGFVLVQDRIDRRDPKLANAPVEAEPLLHFRPLSA